MKRFLFPCFLALFAIIPLTGHAKYEFLLHKTYAERFGALDSLFYYAHFFDDDSASSFAELGLLMTTAKKNGDEELELESQLLRGAYYITGKQKNAKAVESLLSSVIERAKRIGNKQIELRARQFLSRHYIEAENKYGPALDHYLHSYYLLKELTPQEFPTHKEHLHNIATAYYNLGDYAEAKKFMLEARKYEMPLTSRHHKMASYINMKNTFGLIYRNAKQYDSAEYYFQMAYDMAVKENNRTWMGIAGGNIGVIYYLQGKYDQAIPLLQTDVEECFKAGEEDNAVNSLIKLGEISMIRKDISKARQQMLLAANVIPRTSDPYRHKLALFPLLGKLYAIEGNMALAYTYADSARIVKDTVTAHLAAMDVSRMEQKLAMEKYLADRELADREQKLSMIIRNGFLAIVLLIAVIAILVVKKQRMKHGEEKKQLYMEGQLAMTKLELASSQLEHFTQSIHEKNELIERISGELERLQKTKDEVEIREINEDILGQLQQATILTEQQWQDFKVMFEQVHEGYLARLKEKYPTLTPSETRFMVLNKLKLSNKEMANALGVGSDAIRQYRHRLRKKLDLPEEENLHELADVV